MEKTVKKKNDEKITEKVKEKKEEKQKGKSKSKSSNKKSEKENQKKKQKPKKPELKGESKEDTPSKEPEKEEEPTAEVKEEEKIITEKKKKKIMIIDDEHDILFSVAQILKLSNYEVTGVESGRECFEILQQGEIPDLIILDIMMPVMSGWEVQRKLEGNMNWKDIPIIFLTARTTPTAEEMCRRLGRDYITKPFDVNDLKKRIDKIFEGK